MDRRLRSSTARSILIHKPCWPQSQLQAQKYFAPSPASPQTPRIHRAVAVLHPAVQVPAFMAARTIRPPSSTAAPSTYVAGFTLRPRRKVAALVTARDLVKKFP